MKLLRSITISARLKCAGRLNDIEPSCKQYVPSSRWLFCSLFNPLNLYPLGMFLFSFNRWINIRVPSGTHELIQVDVCITFFANHCQLKIAVIRDYWCLSMFIGNSVSDPRAMKQRHDQTDMLSPLSYKSCKCKLRRIIIICHEAPKRKTKKSHKRHKWPNREFVCPVNNNESVTFLCKSPAEKCTHAYSLYAADGDSPSTKSLRNQTERRVKAKRLRIFLVRMCLYHVCCVLCVTEFFLSSLRN